MSSWLSLLFAFAQGGRQLAAEQLLLVRGSFPEFKGAAGMTVQYRTTACSNLQGATGG